MGPSDLRGLIDNAAFDRIEKYVALLGKWRKVTNLISEESYAHIWERHILDSVYLQRQAAEAKCWLDIGAGAGLPGVVIASLLADIHGAEVHCVEIDRRKCAFLRESASQLMIPLKVHTVLAEHIRASSMKAIDVVTARAFSSLKRIVDIAEPFLSDGAVLILPRGRQWRDEVAELDHDRYRVKTHLNPSPGEGVFLRIEPRASQS